MYVALLLLLTVACSSVPRLSAALFVAAGVAYVHSSTFENNTARSGGAIFVLTEGYIYDSTFRAKCPDFDRTAAPQTPLLAPWLTHPRGSLSGQPL